MRILFLSLCLFSLPSTATPEDPAEDLQPIYQINRTDPKRWETIYVLSEARADELDEQDNFDKVGFLGYGAKSDGPGRVQLRQAYRDGWHIYFTELPRGQDFPAGTKLEKFPVYVWQRDAEGLVPVYACSNPDWRNMRYNLDRDEIKRIIEVTRKVKGTRLKYHGIVFYVRPPEDDNEATNSDK